MPAQKTLPAVAGHGSARLPAVNVEDYNVELQDDEGFIGDKASKGAFRQIIDNWREAVEKVGADPLGDEESANLSKKQLDEIRLAAIQRQLELYRGQSKSFRKTLLWCCDAFQSSRPGRRPTNLSSGAVFVVAASARLLSGVRR